MALDYVTSVIHLPDRRNHNSELLLPKHKYHSTDTESIDYEAGEIEDLSAGRWKFDTRLLGKASIGIADGLTVPFALTAGLSLHGDPRIVISGGLSEIVAGCISMAMGGYLGAKGDLQANESIIQEVRRLISGNPAQASFYARSCLTTYQFSESLMDEIVNNLEGSPKSMEDFLLRVHYQLKEPENASTSAFIISSAYVVSGFSLLAPYFISTTNENALDWSCGIMVFELFTCGYFKTLLLGETSKLACLKGALQMVAFGVLAALAAVGCVKLFGSSE